MSQHLGYLLLGLGSGGVIAALALGVVITYRSSHVLNLATGALALLAAYTYSFLREGELFIPVPGLPTSVELGDSFPTAVALPLAIAINALLSVLLYVLVFRPLREARPVARGVASVGVMIVIQSALVLRVGTAPVVVDRIFPSGHWSVASTSIPKDRMLLALAVVVVAMGLASADRFTRFGLATRAVAETEKGAIVVGLKPDRVALANWAITGAVAGLAGVLIAPIVPLVPVSYTLLIVPALAAAALGRFVLIGPAVIGGLLIGMLQSEAVYLVGQHSWLPSAGLPELIPFVVVLVTLSVRGGPLPTRGMLIERSLGRSPRPRRILAPALLGGVAASAAIYMTDHAYRAGLITSLIMGVLGLSFVVVTGYTGQVALAQWALAGVSGFTLSGLTTGWGVPFPLAPLLAALLAAGVGVVAGVPAVRVRGLSFAVVTLALAVAVQGLVFANSSFNGGPGGAQVAKPTLFGLDVSAGVGGDFPRVGFGLVCVVVLVLAASSVALLRRSGVGVAMLTVRSNERAAAASGINVTAVKLLAFAISSFLAGLAGSLYAYRQSVVSAGSFDVVVGLGLFAAVFLGGITSVAGGICAGFLAVHGLLYVVVEQAGATGRWYNLVGGIGLVVAVILHPSGIAGTIIGVWSSSKRRWERPESTSHGDQPPIMPVTSETDEVVLNGSRYPGLESTVILEVQDLSVQFGGVCALDAVTMSVRSGSITGLIGPNGAGKSTLIDAICGVVPAGGTVLFEGRDLEGLRPHRRARQGMARVFQAGELCDDLTVAENVVVGPFWDRRQRAARAQQVLQMLQVDHVASRHVDELSNGQRRLVAIARALAQEPRLLLLDEPAAGLDNRESTWLGQQLRTIRDSGVTIVMIEHDLQLLMRICDHLHVLNFGKLIASGPPKTVAGQPEVVAAYLGSPHAAVETV